MYGIVTFVYRYTPSFQFVMRTQLSTSEDVDD